jgi:hypothetical protein
MDQELQGAWRGEVKKHSFQEWVSMAAFVVLVVYLIVVNVMARLVWK